MMQELAKSVIYFSRVEKSRVAGHVKFNQNQIVEIFLLYNNTLVFPFRVESRESRLNKFQVKKSTSKVMKMPKKVEKVAFI